MNCVRDRSKIVYIPESRGMGLFVTCQKFLKKDLGLGFRMCGGVQGLGPKPSLNSKP